MAGRAMATSVPSMKPRAEARMAAARIHGLSADAQRLGRWPRSWWGRLAGRAAAAACGGGGSGRAVTSGAPERSGFRVGRLGGGVLVGTLAGLRGGGGGARGAASALLRAALAAAVVERIFLALHGAFEMGAAFDRDGLVDDVALHAG